MKCKTINAKVISVTHDNRPIVSYKGKEYAINMGKSNTVNSITLIGDIIMVMYMPIDDNILRFPVFQGVNKILTEGQIC